jgi:ferredoxin
MAHLTLKNAYSSLAERLNRFPQGAPPSELLFKILKMLFSEREADLVSMIPIKPFSVETASRIWKMDLVRSQAVLDKLAGRGILVDIEKNGKSTYVLPPPMAGFFEFSLMRTRDDIDQKVLSELFYEYLNVEEDFIKDLFTRGETQLGRTFVHEPVLSNENLLQEAYGNNLEQFGENVREKVNFICNCCGCCCEAMIAARRFAILNPVHTTNFLPVVTGSECNGCGKCVASCPVEAMTLVSSNNPAKPKMKTAELDGSRCLGCGVCVKACSKEALYLKSRP